MLSTCSSSSEELSTEHGLQPVTTIEDFGVDGNPNFSAVMIMGRDVRERATKRDVRGQFSLILDAPRMSSRFSTLPENVNGDIP